MFIFALPITKRDKKKQFFQIIFKFISLKINDLKNIFKKSEKKFGDKEKGSNFALPFDKDGKTKKESSLKILKKVRKEKVSLVNNLEKNSKS